MQLNEFFDDDGQEPEPAANESPVATDEPAARPRPKRSRTKTVLLVVGSLVAALVLAGAGSAFLFYRHLDNNIQRVPNVFNGVPTYARPSVPASAKGATNILLVGSDSRASEQTTGTSGHPNATSPIGQRTDTMMLVHIDSSKQHAWVISIPRDSWVPIPGHGKAKINAAFSWGGPALMVATVEELTGVRIDHYAEIDFDGFKAMTEALGGVSVPVQYPFTSGGYTYTKGMNYMNGEKALLFVRDRLNQPDADFSRMNNQHAFLLAMFTKVLRTSPFSNPIRLAKWLDVFTKNISVDDTWTASKLRSFLIGLRDLHVNNIQFMTVPYSGTGMEGTQSVVHLDPTVDATLWEALRTDTMADWQP